MNTMYSYKLLNSKPLFFEKMRSDKIDGVNIVTAQNHSVFESGTDTITVMLDRSKPLGVLVYLKNNNNHNHVKQEQIVIFQCRKISNERVLFTVITEQFFVGVNVFNRDNFDEFCCFVL